MRAAGALGNGRTSAGLAEGITAPRFWSPLPSPLRVPPRSGCGPSSFLSVRFKAALDVLGEAI